ncbi:MAG: FAD-dependent oxidoreductase [Leptolyngbyaceae cyanobacterium]
MAVDYDLVILGGTPEGVVAAATAARYGGRVALVLQGLDGRRSPLQMQGLLRQTPSALPTDSKTLRPQWQWQRAQQQAELIAACLTEADQSQLALQGVDIVDDSGEIVRDRPLTVATSARQLTTRAILIATGNRASLPALNGLTTLPYETPQSLLQRDELPTSVAIVGSSPAGLALAQGLRRWQIPVTLITPQSSLLVDEDPDLADWLLAVLRAQGADIQLDSRVTAVNSAETGIILHVADKRLTASTLVIAAPPVPNTEHLGLTVCMPAERGIPVNAYLQTKHPQIYACGSVIGGYELPAIARQEANWAVQNALFWKRQRVDYTCLPYDLPTHPPMARVGLSEPQALRRYQPDQLLISRQPLHHNSQAQWQACITGFCKLIAHQDGRILGAHGAGPAANEWVQTVALLMANKIPWWQLAHFSTLPDSLTDILRQTAQTWERDRWQVGRWRRDWAENWCNWRRSR